MLFLEKSSLTPRLPYPNKADLGVIFFTDLGLLEKNESLLYEGGVFKDSIVLKMSDHRPADLIQKLS